MQIWKQQQWPKQKFCAESLITEAKPIKWIDIQTAFYILGIGLFIAFVILMVENIFKRYRNEKKTLECCVNVNNARQIERP